MALDAAAGSVMAISMASMAMVIQKDEDSMNAEMLD